MIIEVNEDNLYIDCKEELLLDEDSIFSFCQTYAEGEKFKKIEKFKKELEEFYK